MARIVLAIDGGQSGTAVVVGRDDGTILGSGHGGPIRHHAEADAAEVAEDSIRTAVLAAYAEASLDPTADICCISMTGSGDMAEAVIAELVAPDHIEVLESDTIAALASGTGGSGGLAVIAGTGSVAIALNAAGESSIRGGWGWLIGDEGSGFWIAIEALRAAGRGLDGTGPETRLSSALPPLLGETTMRDVYNLVTAGRHERSVVAALATTVTRFADEGDAVASTIVNDAVEHLARLTVATAEAAPPLLDNERVIVLSGGVLSAGSRVSSLLEDRLGELLPRFAVIHPALPPVAGCYFLALRRLGVTVDDRLFASVEQQFATRGSSAAKVLSHPTTTQGAPE